MFIIMHGIIFNIVIHAGHVYSTDDTARDKSLSKLTYRIWSDNNVVRCSTKAR